MADDIVYSSKRTACVCGSKHSRAVITKYYDFDVSSGNYFKCFSCGNTITPKGEKRSNYVPIVKFAPPPPPPPKYNINELFNYSMSLFGNDNFTKYLVNVWGVENECIESYLRTWFIGSDSNSGTIFWYLDTAGKPFYFKYFNYESNECKRKKGNFDCLYGLNFNGKFASAKNSGGMKGLFGLHTIQDKKDVIIVESEKTAILSSLNWSQYSFVATGGASNFDVTIVHQLKKLSHLGKNIYLCFDTDKAGSEANLKHSKTLQSNGIGHYILSINKLVGGRGTDLADYVLSRERGFYGE